MRLAALVPVVTLGAAVLVAPSAHAAGSSADGPVTVILPACGQSSPVGEVLTPGCSYIALPKKGGGVYYAHLTSGGEIGMAGSLSAGRLTLPVSGQTWPNLSVAGGLATVRIKRSDVTGALDAAGTVTLSLPYEATISAGILGSCTVKGTATVSSAATDPIGGGQGRAYDPVSNGFAAAGTTPAPLMQGALCKGAADYLDLSRGVGWYLDGRIQPSPRADIAQTAVVRVPERIKRKGRTVLLGGSVVTNADQKAAVAVTWGIERSARGGSRKYARVSSRNGKVTIRTTGRSKKLFVRLTLKAPPTQGFEAFRWTRLWRVR